MVDYVITLAPKGSKIALLARHFTDDMIDSLSDYPPEFAEFYAKQVATMLFWVATGDSLPDIPLPEDFTV